MARCVNCGELLLTENEKDNSCCEMCEYEFDNDKKILDDIYDNNGI